MTTLRAVDSQAETSHTNNVGEPIKHERAYYAGLVFLTLVMVFMFCSGYAISYLLSLK